MKNIIVILTYFISIVSIGQTVSNGSFTGLQPGTNTFNVTDWAKCPGTSPDVCDITFPTFMWGPTTVPASDSPDGGTWLGLASQDECVNGSITGLTPGTTYTLCFYGANFGSGQGSGLFDGINAQPVITIGGTSQTFNIPMVANTWNIYSMTFTATATSMTLNVSAPDITGGDYFDPAAYYALLDGFSISTTGSCAVTATTICDGDTFTETASGFTADPGYQQLYVLVYTVTGNIVATNTTGTFTQADYGAGNIGDYEVYAVNTNDATVIAEMNGTGSWATAQTNAGPLCADIIGPQSYIIENCCDLDVTTIVTDETCNGADDGAIDFTITGSGTYDIIIGGTVEFNDVTAGTNNWTNQPDGTYSVQIVDINDATCDSTFNITIGQGPTQADATISAAGPFCESDAAVTLSAVDGGGTWTGTGITNSTTGEFDPATAGPGTHTITYTISGTCGDTDTEDIVVNADQDATFSYTSGSFCLTDPDPAATITGTTGGTFTIDNSGVINAADGTIDIGASGAGSYTVTYTTAGPCADVQTFGVTLTSGADATISAAGPFCESDAAVTLSAVDGGGTWTGTGITNGTTGEFDPATAGAGTHTITYTITGTCGDTDTEDIVVNADQDASFSYSSGSFCLTDPDPAATITGTTGGTFTIDNGGTINAADGTIDIGASGAGSYTVTYTTAGPCADVQTFGVTLTTGADATISAAGPFCESDAAVTLSAVDAGGTWTGTGITNGTTGEFDPATAGAGTHTITYTITGTCGDTDTEDIVVTADDDASFDYAATSFCVSDTDPLGNILGTTGGIFTINNGGTINPTTGEVDLDASGIGNYTITYTTAGTCPDASTFDITITNTLDATITAAGPFCESDAAVNLTAVDGGGTWSGTGITDANAGTFDPAGAGAGTHTITYTIAGGCGATDQIDIVVNTTDDAAFSYATITYCLSDTDPVANVTGTTGGSFSINNGGTINPTTGEVDLDASGAGTFTITYTTGGTCPASSTVDITINSSISASITPAGPYCIGDIAVTLNASTPGGVWSGNGITDTSTGIFNPDTAGAGVHQIIYTIGGNCGDADTITITVSDVPSANLPTSYTVDYGSSVVMTASGGGTYSWDPSENLDCDDCETPEASPEITTAYCVTVVDSGCVDTACTTVIVEYNCGEVAVPTAFTPNSGDVNSMECVLGSCVIDMHFRIYDRWGELVFESTDQNVCWDGTHKRNGKEMSTGVYVYQLDGQLINGETFSQKGNITLIR